jgi:putative hydrolase of the HAD superfamily
VAAKSDLKAILFDIDDTLYSTTEFAALARRNAIRAMVDMGLDLEPDDALRELNEVISEFSSNYDQHYDKLLLRLPRKVRPGVNPALVVAAGVVAYHETKFRQLHAFRDAEEALAALKEKTDLTLGILTEGLEIKQAEKLVRLGIVKYLDPGAIFISDQVGISKPNPKLYLHALNRLDLEADEVMYVGDNPDKDITPAKAVGMIAVRHRGTGRYADRECLFEPDHEISDFHELMKILRKDYGLPV